MKVIEKVYKCAVCGEENKYKEVMSNFVRGYADFDMRPTGSMMGIGDNIMECPNCHYANYSIYNTIENRFANNLELWNNSSDFQEIIKNYSGSLRKILLVAKQYKNNMDYKNLYKTYIMASWVCDDKDALEFRENACAVFIDKILPNYRDELLQITDLLRMIKEFEIAGELLNIVNKITDDSNKDMLRIIDAEQGYINNNDSSRHNLSEIFKEK